jgi:hypothetical protein
MEKMQTPVLAGVGGAAILAAVMSMGGKPATAPDADKADNGAEKSSASQDATPLLAPNRNGPWYAVCREYSTYKFDDGPAQRLTGGYVEVRSPDAANAEATEITQVVKGVHEKIAVKRYLRASLSSCIPADKKQDVKVMIATVPDPDETEMRLEFDRDVEAIQEGAAERGYHYTGYWFPWRPLNWKGGEKGADDAEQEALQRQEPGVLVFRKDDGERLFAFLVGETPSSGVNRVQMALALRYSGDLYPPSPPKNTPLSYTAKQPVPQPTCIRGPVLIAGPHFSASFLSLKDVLSDVVFPEECKSTAEQRSVRIIAPDASSDDLMTDFEEFCGPDDALNGASNCALLPLAISEAEKEKAVFAYLKSLGYHDWQIAHLVEDESAFGDSTKDLCGSSKDQGEEKRCKDQNKENDHEFGLVLSFPRELSSLRSASDKQSEQVAESVGNLLTLSGGADTVKFSPDEPEERDRPISYSPEEQAAEASNSLETMVRLLRQHKIRAVLISATNPLDRLLLLEHLHDQLPDIRVVVAEAEELETNKPHFVDMVGTLSVSSFPTLPERLVINGKPVARRSFAESGQEGEFAATVLLLDGNWSADPAQLTTEFAQAKESISKKSLPISVVGESGFRLMPFGPGEIAGGANHKPPVLFKAVVPKEGQENQKEGQGKQGQQNLIDVSLSVDQANSPPRGFYVFALVVFTISIAHLVLLLSSQRNPAPDWSYPQRSSGAIEWKRLYFLYVLSNQVFLLNYLVLRLSMSAWSAFSNPVGLTVIAPLAWLLTIACGVAPVFLLTRAGRAAAPAWSSLVVQERGQILYSASITTVYLIWSLRVVATWQFGGSQIYLERFLQLCDGLSPVLPFACVVFAYALWALLQLRRIGWVVSRVADLGVGVEPKSQRPLYAATERLLLKIEGLGDMDGYSWLVTAGLVVGFVVTNLWESTRSFETPTFHLWFLIWGVPMLLVTVIVVFFQTLAIWAELKKVLRCLELTPMKEEFEKLGGGGLIDIKIWDLAKPQRLFQVHKLTFEALERILRDDGPKVEEAKRAVQAIIAADAQGNQATKEQSKDLNEKLNLAMGQAYGALDGAHDGIGGESLPVYIALRLVALIRYALLQMRNLLYFVVYGYMLAAISVISYPFQGRKSLGELLSLVFAGLLVGVGVILVGIQRNSMLSRLEKGSGEGTSYIEIARNLLSVGGIPALALVASQFPSVAQYALSWLRPVLGALH